MTYKFDFMRYRVVYFVVAIIILTAGVISLYVQGLNLGIDFVSGSRMDINIGEKANLEKGKEVLKQLGYDNPNARIGGKNQEIVIFRTDEVLNEKQIKEMTAKFNQAFQTDVSIQEQVVDPIIGRELAKNAVISVLIASIGIMIYIAFRFEYRFAIAAILTLFHDAFVTISMFSFLQLEVDIVFIAAVLTVVGYSVNDTIVIFDRIRENVNQIKEKLTMEKLTHIINESINQTLTRPINTGLTVIFSALALYLIGGESIRNFSLALIFGLVAAVYSSIFLASQIWLVLKTKSIKAEKSTGVK